MAFWLSPEQIAFITNEWRKIPGNVAPDVKENWAAIAFRGMAALHKAGVIYEPLFPGEDEVYHLAVGKHSINRPKLE